MSTCQPQLITKSRQFPPVLSDLLFTIIEGKHGPHFSGLTKFPDFSNIVFPFYIIFNVLFLSYDLHLLLNHCITNIYFHEFVNNDLGDNYL